MTNEPTPGSQLTIACCDATIDENRWKSGKEIALTWAAIFFTLAACGIVIWEQYPILLRQIEAQHWGEVAAHCVFFLIVAFLIYGSFVYQATRLGYLKRRRQHSPASREILDRVYDNPRKPLTILVPSYKEDRRVILQTLMSAALQEYPQRRVVLLIDNPPHPKDAVDVAQLAEARELPLHIAVQLDHAAKPFKTAFADFQTRQASSTIDYMSEATRLSNLWQQAGAWFEREAQDYPVTDHTDRLYVDKVLRARAAEHALRARSLMQALENGELLSLEQVQTEYRKLAAIFDCELTSFERKRYQNLSHEPNKAMNLNSYIGLVGQHFRERATDQGFFLDKVSADQAQLAIPDTDYFVTLDADSILLPEYALRLISVMEQTDNERIAVAQTPYSAIPGAPSELERIAGATTDMQYIIHQGFTQHDATYWVGANALLRHTALKEIAVTEQERGYPVQRFIQDRTVIEDTESSVDLVARGWRLYNYPERLAYSATPPDFGSLIIQRRRWANGGLIILPKLLAYLSGRPQGGIAEGLLRSHYLISIAVVNIGLLLMLAFPFGESIQSIWLPLSALPYFFLYGRDLVLCGYRPADFFKVYALNLLLIPINIGGVLKSIQQGVSGAKIPFGRTPKVQGRTAAAPLYIIAGYLLLALWAVSAAFDVTEGHYGHAFFVTMNATFLLYAIRAFIGYRESWEDIQASWARKPDHTPIEAIADTSVVIWDINRRRRERRFQSRDAWIAEASANGVPDRRRNNTLAGSQG
ncbi:Cellulose synthase catalytic subunit [UDP-forming] [Methylophilaceae bacterium]|nr:Cellulose synthase catalytic subunit [UDP-forming] [Methylophilaceae bacterium]